MSLRVWRAPGRVNVIGEHVDYLGGLVLPFACDLELRIEVEDHPDEVVLTSADLPGVARVPVDGSVEPADGWPRQVWSVVKTLHEGGTPVTGVRGRIASDIPVGAGLSSSAAFAVAVALAVSGGRRPDPDALARAELLATGVPVGVMDQTAVLEARAGHALLLDCSTRGFDHVPIHEGVGFVVVDTGTRRQLADGRYADRRAEVEHELAAVGATTLAEVDVETVSTRRLRHAASENARVPAAAAALREGEVETLGRLVSESHASLRDDFGVSSPELDAAVAAAEAQDGCTGARLVGAGFAGCVLAVTHREAATRVASDLTEASSRRAWAVNAVDAAGKLARNRH